MTLRKFSSEQQFNSETVNFVREIIAESIANNGKAFVGLSGGQTPKVIYEQLADQDLDFSKIHFFLTDERYTNLESTDANYQLIKNTLFKKCQTEFKPIQTQDNPEKWHFHYFETNLSIQNCLEKYQEQLFLIPELSLDLIILGIGVDGHFASIFPGNETLILSDTPSATKSDSTVQDLNGSPKSPKLTLVAHTQTENFQVKDRLTVLPALILQSKNILVLLKGKEKEAVLIELDHGTEPVLNFPAKILNGHSNFFIHYGDF